MRRWFWHNSLSVTMFVAFAVFLLAQSYFGWQVETQELLRHGLAPQPYLAYLASGDFVEATFENWESEFLQMAWYVLLTAWLVQRGSPESNPVDDGVRARAEGAVTVDSPTPVRRGGWARRLYANSLSIALFALFAGSFLLHLLGGTAAHNQRLALAGQPPLTVGEYAVSSQFWFESMQNWQSEFLAVGALVVLSVFLRQRGSAQSKPVAAAHPEHG